MIEMKLKGFLWRGSTGSGGYKVSWDLVCQPISHGGLGIRNVQSMNQALMAKHLWQVVTNQRDSIWVTWVLLYRLKHHTVWSYRGTGGSWCWKKLMKLRCQLIKGLKFRVGNGDSFKLWLDPWLVDGPLINKYPRGPLITGLSVDSWLNVVIDRDNWNWPSQAHTDIAEIISNLPPIHNGSNDQVVWKNSSGMFSTTEAYLLFSSITDPVPWASLLRGPFTTPRHKFILWLAILGRLSTLDKPWCNSSNQRCILCDQNHVESHQHLFFKCTYAKTCLQILKVKVKFTWPHSDWSTGITWASKKWRGSHFLNAAARALLASLVYFIWMERNGRRFQSKATSAEGLSKLIIEHVRLRIISEEIRPSIQAFNLYRIWHIAWFV
ncbi:UNVERIFIED_CONTAM: hypothetical protein Scaly_3131900 [Sesamum calycinum]|uniref:Reverse transcriptase zinc-binding domain-containing protein n=1 Tax=Sesamum calycinum TaxID=2727403 RepID=A0AAW2JID1_9LAMI